jgi:uncharacterized protein YndB with AHSA1/START domain
MPKFEREVEIDAPIETVWKVITDPSHWPQWLPGVDSVSNVVSTGGSVSFDWTSDEGTGSGQIVSAEPMKRLEIMTQIGDDKDSHVFELKESGGFLGMNADECTVTYTLDTLTGGGMLGRFIAGGNPKDTMRVKKAMHTLRKVVESL